MTEALVSSCGCASRKAPDVKRDHKLLDQPIRSLWSTLTDDWVIGDCVMEKGSSIVFNSDGTGKFSSRVKTNHTHSGDTWHQTFVVKNKPGAIIFALGTWDGPRMSDDHGYYDWVVEFAWNQAFFDVIDNVEWRGGC